MLLRVIGISMCLAHIIHGLNGSTSDKNWNFEFISFETFTSDENLLKINAELKQISRGTFGITGSGLLNFDIEENDDNMVEALVYRRAISSSEYKITPFTMPRRHIFVFFNTFYKAYVMETAKKCSNLPVFETKFQPPLEKKLYTFHECQMITHSMPSFLLEGFYKVIIAGTGTVNYTLTLVMQVEKET